MGRLDAQRLAAGVAIIPAIRILVRPPVAGRVLAFERDVTGHGHDDLSREHPVAHGRRLHEGSVAERLILILVHEQGHCRKLQRRHGPRQRELGAEAAAVELLEVVGVLHVELAALQGIARVGSLRPRVEGQDIGPIPQGHRPAGPFEREVGTQLFQALGADEAGHPRIPAAHTASLCALPATDGRVVLVPAHEGQGRERDAVEAAGQGRANHAQARKRPPRGMPEEEAAVLVREVVGPAAQNRLALIADPDEAAGDQGRRDLVGQLQLHPVAQGGPRLERFPIRAHRAGAGGVDVHPAHAPASGEVDLGGELLRPLVDQEPRAGRPPAGRPRAGLTGGGPARCGRRDAGSGLHPEPVGKRAVAESGDLRWGRVMVGHLQDPVWIDEVQAEAVDAGAEGGGHAAAAIVQMQQERGRALGHVAHP